MKYLIPLFFLPFSLIACANSEINCTNPINTQEMRECAEKNSKQMKGEFKALESRIISALVDYSGKESSNQFIDLQKKWENFIELQCVNVRGLYGRGSLAGISYINCKNKYLKYRITDLSSIYNEVISIE